MIIVNLRVMQKQFLQQLQALGYLGETTLVAVSGGLDSVVLVDLMTNAKFPVVIAHVNFQLRGAESGRDEKFVQQLGSSLGIPVHIRRCNTNNYAIEHGISIQMAARELRYSWFKEIMETEKIGLLMTAHHLSDSLETTLLYLSRGTGLSGLAGIPSRGSGIIRPLLSFKRDEIESYARRQNLQWIEDSSNSSTDYDRNFIRHKIVPLLKELNPSVEDSHRRTLSRLNGAEEMFEIGLAEVRKKYVLEEHSQLKILKILISAFTYPVPILLELIQTYGFNFDQCESIIQTSHPGKIFLSGEFQLIVDREAFIVSKRLLLPEVVILPGQNQAALGNGTMKIAEQETRTFSKNPLIASLDGSRLKFPLVWRPWKAGDVFYPLGMSQRKKLSDFMIDRKIAASDKNEVTVLESNGDIAWVVGHRIDDRFKISPQTMTVITLQISYDHPPLSEKRGWPESNI
jgi:tRNA(Ile)-lysidine synthase